MLKVDSGVEAWRRLFGVFLRENSLCKKEDDAVMADGEVGSVAGLRQSSFLKSMVVMIFVVVMMSADPWP